MCAIQTPQRLGGTHESDSPRAYPFFMSSFTRPSVKQLLAGFKRGSPSAVKCEWSRPLLSLSVQPTGDSAALCSGARGDIWSASRHGEPWPATEFHCTFAKPTWQEGTAFAAVLSSFHFFNENTLSSSYETPQTTTRLPHFTSALWFPVSVTTLRLESIFPQGLLVGLDMFWENWKLLFCKVILTFFFLG